MIGRRAIAGAVWVFLLALSRLARANGAFPDSLQLILPADRPQQIGLATNFGLIISDDGGATWTWTCEQKETLMGSLYAVGPSPRDRFFSLSPLTGLAYSDDESCSWTSSGGSLAVALAKDFFPDPADPDHVWAIASSSDAALPSYQLFESRDGGATFGDPVFTAPAGDTLIGIESSLSDPATLYLTGYATTATAPSIHPKLLRSRNGGADFTPVDLEPVLGNTKVRIIAVDPSDPLTLIVRVIDATSEGVAISRDGGATFTVVITIPDSGTVTSFARLADGTLLVGGAQGAQALGFRSTDGGLSFQNWPGVPHLRALGARGGKLYAAAKNYTDGWAVGVSDDGGATFQPYVTYDRVSAIRACARATCEDQCDFQAGGGVWPAAVCQPQPDGGAGGTGPPSKSGCGCAATGRDGGSGGDGRLVAVGFVTLALAFATRRRPRTK